MNLDRADAFWPRAGRSARARGRRGLMLIDSHVNLHAPQFDEDRDAVIARARAAGVGLMVDISDKVSTFEAVHAVAMAHADIWCTVGTHPHEAKENPDLTADDLVDLAARPQGGRHRRDAGSTSTTTSARATCRPQVFRAHIDAARETGLPLVVHTREADDVMADILERSTPRRRSSC